MLFSRSLIQMDHWVGEYLLGIWDSCRGFVVFLSLDSPEAKPPETISTPEKLNSNTKAPLTQLALRRLEASKGRAPTKSTETPSEKPRARQRLCYCILLNVGCLVLAKVKRKICLEICPEFYYEFPFSFYSIM